MKTITAAAAMSIFFTMSLSCFGDEARRGLVEAATVIAVAANVPASDIRVLIEWTNAHGRSVKMNRIVAFGLELGQENDPDLPIIQRGFKTASGWNYAFTLPTIQGRRELVVERYTVKEYFGWRIREDGSVITAIHISPDSPAEFRRGPLHEAEFDETLELLRSRAAASKGN
jgi:hypothetical protein